MTKTRSGSEKTLGQILIAKGIISQKQLDLALKINTVQPDKYLGEILFHIGVPQQKINQALYYFHIRKTIGAILIDQQLISFEQLGIPVDIDHHTILPGTTIVSGNWAAIGGGIFNHETGRMVLSSSQITDNIASQAGGIQNKGVMGIQIDINNNDSILLGTTLLEGNQAVSTEENPTALDGGANYNDGALKIANSTIEHNTARGGGGILNWFDDNTSLGTVEITGSTIANNWAGNGGGIENGCSNGQIGCGRREPHAPHTRRCRAG